MWTANGATTVTLLTYGSPIRRFFTSFFPEHLFPSSVDACARLAAERIGRFRWLNGYRPYDEIGAAIGLSDTGWTKEFSTQQAWRWKSLNHSDYWSDPEVRDRTVKQLAELAFSPMPLECPDASVEMVAALTGSNSHRKLIAQVLRWSTLAIVIGALGASLVSSILLRRDTLYEIRLHGGTVMEKGTETQATVSVSERLTIMERLRTAEQMRNNQPPQKDMFLTDAFHFDYVAAGAPHHVGLAFTHGGWPTETYDEAKFNLRINSTKLMNEALMHEGTKGQEMNTSVLSPGKVESLHTGKLEGVMLRYDPASPEFFVLPMFLPVPGEHWEVYFEAGALVIAFSVFYGLLAFLVYRGITLLIGDSLYIFSRKWPEIRS